MFGKGLLLVSFFLVTPAFGNTIVEEYKRVNCTRDTLTVIPDTCGCDMKSTNGVVGRAHFECSALACEEFKPVARPKSCGLGTRGVTCHFTSTAHHLPICQLHNPRLEGNIKAADYCKEAEADLQAFGFNSRFYRNLDPVFCTPHTESFPPADGWEFAGFIKEGWN